MAGEDAGRTDGAKAKTEVFGTRAIEPSGERGWSTWETQDAAKDACWRLHRMLRGQRRIGARDDDIDVTATSPPPGEVAIVLGETGAGRTSFAMWCHHHFNQRDGNQCHLIELKPKGPTGAPAHRGPDGPAVSHSSDGLLKANAVFDVNPLEGSQFVKLVGEQRGNSGCTLLVADVSDLPPRDAVETFGALNRLVEVRQGMLGVRLFFLADQRIVFRQGPFSEFARLANVYRLGMLGPRELGRMWRSQAEDVTGAEVEAFEKSVWAWTGGQPLLVQILYDELRAKMTSGPSGLRVPSASLLEGAGRHLRDHPPLATLRWRHELADLCLDPRVRGNVTALTRGQRLSRLSNPTAAERLFAGGWIRRESGRWHIRSRCHAAWAREPLRDPRRYLETERTGQQ